MILDRLRFLIQSTLFFAFLYIANLFALRVILISLLAIAIAKAEFPKINKENFKDLIIFSLGLFALVLNVVTLYLKIFMIVGDVYIDLLSSITWAIIPILLLLIFTNLIELPILVRIFRSFQNKNVKSLLVISLVLMSSLSIIWESDYRTIRDQDELNQYFSDIIDNIEDTVQIYYKDYLLDSVITSVTWINTIKFQHTYLRYTFADIYLMIFESIWYNDNFSLIVVGSGVLVSNYVTETGKSLVKAVSLEYNTTLKSNATAIETLLTTRFHFGTHLYSIGKMYLSLYNSSSLCINETFTANWTITEITLCNDAVFKTTKYDAKFNGTISIEFERTEKNWRSVYLRNNFIPEKTRVINVLTFLAFDPITFLEFYKYELALIGVLLMTFQFLSILTCIEKVRNILSKIP